MKEELELRSFCGGEAVRREFDHHPLCGVQKGERCDYDCPRDYIRPVSQPTIHALLQDARSALDGLIDDEPCSKDHHGYCQAHGLSDPCEMVIARQALTKIETALASFTPSPAPEPVAGVWEKPGWFAEWSSTSLAAQCRAQARENLDPEYCQFMVAVADRLAALGQGDDR